MNIQTSPLEAEILTPHAFFTGKLEFSGFVQDLRGAVRRHYSGTIDCRKEGEMLVLDEVLNFNDGEQETRMWRISPNVGAMTADADDLVGKARIEGKSADEMRWTYTMNIEIGGKLRSFDFEDVFVQTAQDTLISRTAMRKFGITVANLYSTYRKIPS